MVLADQFERFGQRAQLLEIIEHAVGQLLHAADDLVGEEEDHRKRADRNRARQRIAPGERDKAEQKRQRRHRHEAAHQDQEGAQAPRRVHLVGKEMREEAALIIGLGEGAHEIGIGDRVDQPSRRGGNLVGKRLGQHDAALREHDDNAEIDHRPCREHEAHRPHGR